MDEPTDRAPLSPEARRKRALQLPASMRRHIEPGSRPFEIVRRVFLGTFRDGFIHAGNLAYMSILSMFPFFITVTALLSLFGRSAEGVAALEGFLRTVPPSVAAAVEEPIKQVISARTGWLLWLGGIFGLWTFGSLIETIRDILRRAYGTAPGRAFWQYRLGSIGLLLGAVFLMVISFSAQVLITAVEQTISHILPQFGDWLHGLSITRLVPGIGLFVSLYLLFLSLTPRAYRSGRYPKWPGALLTASWWVLVTALLPVILSNLANYDVTYGSLAGVMIALFFFYLVGLGVVIGAELNAALAETPEERDEIGQSDDRKRMEILE